MVVVGPVRSIPNAAATQDVLVTGMVPSGDTSESVTHFIVDSTSHAIVGQVILPNAVNRPIAVSMTVKVGSAGGSYAIGTFGADGKFHPTPFLQVESRAQGSGGAALGGPLKAI